MLDFNKPHIEDAEERKKRIQDALQRDIRSVVRRLYPKAAFSQQDARVGDVDGKSGHSLSIALAPHEKAGMWIDYATDDRGDVFTLIERALNCANFGEVLTEAEAIVGGRPTPRQIGKKQLQDKEPETQRPEIVETIDYVYKNREGRRIATVYRDILDNGKKKFRVHRSSDSTFAAPDPRPLYNLPDVFKSDEVILVEGEKCADALASQGLCATTAMFGSNTKLDKIDWTPLAGRRVILWPDNDETGFKYVREVRPLLEAMGCQVLEVAIPEGKPDGWDAADAIEDGEDVRAHLRVVEAPRTPKLPFFTVPQVGDLPPPEWLIEGLLIKGGVSALYAPAESYKSFIALDMALSIASGQKWRNKTTIPGQVIYMISEGTGGWYKRIKVWLDNRNEGAVPEFYTIPTSIAMTEADDAQMLINTVQEHCENPVMIVVDTLARNFGYGDENSTKDMNAFVAAVDRVRDATGAHIMLVHHTGKDTTQGGRGSSVLRAALDTEMTLIRDDLDSPFVDFKITKQKDIEKAEALRFEMVQVETSHPKTGEVITSLLPVLRDNSSLSKKPVRLAKKDREVANFLWENGSHTTQQLGEKFPYSESNLKRILYKLRDAGEISSLPDGKHTRWEFVGTNHDAS